jgi:hypothetical protein
MNLQENIERLIEERQAEAIKKKLSEKLRLVATMLGFAIRDKVLGSRSVDTPTAMMGYSSHELIDAWGEDPTEEEEIPTDADIGESAVLGYYFDGLSSGINLQIYLEDAAGFMKASHQGKDVYQESQGKLEMYIPSAEWENWVESLYRSAEKRAKVQDQKDREIEKLRKKKLMDRALDFVKKHWGV